MIAIDTNLLVYAQRPSMSEHVAADRALNHLAAGDRRWGFALPSVAEFASIVTRASLFRPPSSPNDVKKFISELEADGAEVWTPSPGFFIRLLNEATNAGVTGARLFDLQIGLIALEAGATEIWTHDKNFASPRGLKIVDPILKPLP